MFHFHHDFQLLRRCFSVQERSFLTKKVAEQAVKESRSVRESCSVTWDSVLIDEAKDLKLAAAEFFRLALDDAKGVKAAVYLQRLPPDDAETVMRAAATYARLALFEPAEAIVTEAKPQQAKPSRPLLDDLRHVLQTRVPMLYAQVLEPTLADLREEHSAALAERHPFKARWILLQGCGALAAAAASQLGFSLLGRIAALWKARSPK